MIRSQLIAAKTLVLLVVVMVILSWLNQNSMSLYCQQKYHSGCDLPLLTDNDVWRLGGDINRAMGEARDSFVASLEGTPEPSTTLADEVASLATPIALPAGRSVEHLPSIETAHAGPKPAAHVPGKPAVAARVETPPAALPPAAPVVPAAASALATAPVAPVASTPSAPVVAPLPRPVRPALPAGPISEVTLEADDEVFFVGDSLMQGVAPHLANTLLKRYNIKSINLSKQSTGLAYPGFFNWPQTVQSTLAAHPNIRLLVIFLGPNDPWDMPEARGKPFLRFKSAEWESLYRQRVQSIFEQARLNNAHVIWVGPPNMNTPKLSTAMQYLRELYKSETQQYQQIYLSANDAFGYQADEFSFYSVDAAGKKTKVRVDDGIHFTTTGQKLIAEQVLKRINVHNPGISER